MLEKPPPARKPINRTFDLAGKWWLDFPSDPVRWLSGLKQSFAKAP
jgi:hypothetical protein